MPRRSGRSGNRLSSLASLLTVAVVWCSPAAAVPEPAAPAASAPPTAPAALTWRDHDAALAAARETGRPVLIHFTADWCKWCKVMQQETYIQPEIRGLMADAFVTAQVDADRQPRLRARYNVQGLPTIWFLTSEGEPIIYIPGYVDAPTFLSVLRWIASGAHAHVSYEAYMAAED
jgi:thiol:disulfide interchange protein